MKMYEYWDNGDYSRAWRKYVRLTNVVGTFEFPNAITRLGKNEKWPNADDTENLLAQINQLIRSNNPHDSLYLNIDKLVVYAQDELAKIRRLIADNEDYRSAFLRSVGLLEVLLTSRIVILVETKGIKIAEKIKEKQAVYQSYSEFLLQDSTWHETILDFCINGKFSLHGLLSFFNKGNFPNVKLTIKDLRKIGDTEETKTWLFRHSSSENCLDQNELISITEKDLRNNAIHTYLSIPKTITDKTLQKVQSNFENFKQNWGSKLGYQQTTKIITETVQWDVLAELCGAPWLRKS